MELDQRKKDILDLLYQKGKVTVAELAATFFVSEMTVRRDLTEMEKGGYLRRYRGGAVLRVSTRQMPLEQRVYFDEEEKKELCRRAVGHLRDHMTVFLDSSSTCLYLIPLLQNYKDIRIVTNSVQALLDASALHIPCLLIGGEYYEQDMCLVGSMTEQYRQCKSKCLERLASAIRTI